MSRFLVLMDAEEKGDDKVWRAWPILLIARVFGLRRAPVGLKASMGVGKRGQLCS
jgi:hypothetical protein